MTRQFLKSFALGKSPPVNNTNDTVRAIKFEPVTIHRNLAQRGRSIVGRHRLNLNNYKDARQAVFQAKLDRRLNTHDKFSDLVSSSHDPNPEIGVGVVSGEPYVPSYTEWRKHYSTTFKRLSPNCSSHPEPQQFRIYGAGSSAESKIHSRDTSERPTVRFSSNKAARRMHFREGYGLAELANSRKSEYRYTKSVTDEDLNTSASNSVEMLSKMEQVRHQPPPSIQEESENASESSGKMEMTQETTKDEAQSSQSQTSLSPSEHNSNTELKLKPSQKAHSNQFSQTHITVRPTSSSSSQQRNTDFQNKTSRTSNLSHHSKINRAQKPTDNSSSDSSSRTGAQQDLSWRPSSQRSSAHSQQKSTIDYHLTNLCRVYRSLKTKIPASLLVKSLPWIIASGFFLNFFLCNAACRSGSESCFNPLSFFSQSLSYEELPEDDYETYQAKHRPWELVEQQPCFGHSYDACPYSQDTYSALMRRKLSRSSKAKDNDAFRRREYNYRYNYYTRH